VVHPSTQLESYKGLPIDGEFCGQAKILQNVKKFTNLSEGTNPPPFLHKCCALTYSCFAVIDSTCPLLWKFQSHVSVLMITHRSYYNTKWGTWLSSEEEEEEERRRRGGGDFLMKTNGHNYASNPYHMTEYSYVDSYTDSYLCSLFIYLFLYG
jgi:hypothetical protein